MIQPSLPGTLEEALDPAWLGSVLAAVTGGAPITRVETVEIISTLATKVRFTVAFDGARNGKEAFCLKALFDVQAEAAGPAAGEVSVQEARFYRDLAPRLRMRVAGCAAAVIDPEASRGLVIIRDLVADGARFGTALDLFTADGAAASLEQLAGLHANRALLEEASWVRGRISETVNTGYVTPASLQVLMNGPRCDPLSPRMRDAGLLFKAMYVLAEENARRPQFLIHGDSHGGNIFHTAEGPGLIDWQMLQRGNWALDVAYHICAVLPIDVAERDERRLLAHYLAVLRSLGGAAPDIDEAWDHYRTSVIYGYFLWAMTRLVDPEMTNALMARLGAAATRHESYRLLGL